MSQQSKGGQDPDYGFVLLVVLAIMIGYGIYHFFHSYIAEFVLYIKYYEIKALNFFFPSESYSSLIDNLYFSLHEGIHNVSLTDIQSVSSFVGNTLLWPLAILGLLISLILYFAHPSSGYKDIETMDSLRSKLKGTYPCIQVVTELDLVRQPINEGPWAMALSPVEFAKKYKLLTRTEEGKLSVDNLNTRILFTEQLGPYWQGVDVLPKHQKAIFAALCLFVDYKRSEAESLLEQFALSATKDSIVSGKLDYSKVDSIINKYKNSQLIKDITSSHAYVYTVFTQMLSQARSTGIVASASFLWLKPMDRLLWYTLNNVGRKAVFIETGAVTAHWKAEVKLGYAVKRPLLDSALDALKEAVTTRVVKDSQSSMHDNEIFDSELETILDSSDNNPNPNPNPKSKSKSENEKPKVIENETKTVDKKDTVDKKVTVDKSKKIKPKSTKGEVS